MQGNPNVNWLLLPRKAFVYNPTAVTTSMFKMERGFDMSKLGKCSVVYITVQYNFNFFDKMKYLTRTVFSINQIIYTKYTNT